MALPKICILNFKRRLTKTSAGFTLIEVIIVIAIISFVAAFGLTLNINDWDGFSFRSDCDAIINALLLARSRAVNNICLGSDCADGKPHGIYFNNSSRQIVVFQGDSYNDHDPANEKIELENKSISVFAADENGSVIDKVVFEQLSGGLKGGSDLITIKLNDVSSWRTAVIQINKVGRIDY